MSAGAPVRCEGAIALGERQRLRRRAGGAGNSGGSRSADGTARAPLPTRSPVARIRASQPGRRAETRPGQKSVGPPLDKRRTGNDERRHGVGRQPHGLPQVRERDAEDPAEARGLAQLLLVRRARPGAIPGWILSRNLDGASGDDRPLPSPRAPHEDMCLEERSSVKARRGLYSVGRTNIGTPATQGTQHGRSRPRGRWHHCQRSAEPIQRAGLCRACAAHLFPHICRSSSSKELEERRRVLPLTRAPRGQSVAG